MPTSAPPQQGDDDGGDSTGEPGPLTTGINPPDPDPDSTAGGEGTTTGDVDDSTSTGERGDESSSEGGETSSTTAGVGEPCEAETTCNGSSPQGGVSGDTSVPPLTLMGDEPMWLQVEVSENDSGVFATGMSATLTLTSETGNWDINAYLGAPGDTNGCGGMEQESETDGVDSVSFQWGESGTFANNVDDGTFIAVEIFPRDNLCTPDASWTLVVTGNG